MRKRYTVSGLNQMDAFCKAYNDRIGQNPCNDVLPYPVPYGTGEEFIALRNELEIARQEILVKYPMLKGEYEQRSFYSKYSKESDHLSSLLPSLVRYVSIGRSKPRLLNSKPSRLCDNYGNPLGYHEYVYDKDDKLLMNKIYWNNRLQVVLYVVEYNGYTYVLDLDDEDYDFDCYVSRMQYYGSKLIKYEEYEPVSCGGWYYSEIYYNFNGKEYCTALYLDHGYERDTSQNSVSHTSDVWKGIEEKRIKFLNGLKLPITDEQSPVYAFAYELTFNDRNKVARIDEISLYSGVVKTIYPKKPKIKSDFPATRQSCKRLKERLKEVRHNSKKLITFTDFWQTFKIFCIEDKFDCADDSVLWEPTLSENKAQVHIARQFVHENDGLYEGMEQLNIDFDVAVKINSSISGAYVANWSQADLEEYFFEVEQSIEFKAIDAYALIDVNVYFGEV